jgi:NADH-quinone oxidoreductase subunit A
MGTYEPLALVVFLAVLLPVLMMGMSAMLGPRRPTGEKLTTYECGAPPIETPRHRFAVKFYVVAMLFIVFDVEGVFLFPWAVLFRKLGLFGFLEMLFFLAVLTLGLVYVWKRGALQWD